VTCLRISDYDFEDILSLSAIIYGTDSISKKCITTQTTPLTPEYVSTDYCLLMPGTFTLMSDTYPCRKKITFLCIPAA